MDSFFEMLKFILPAALVLYGMYLAIKVMVSKSLLAKELEIKHRSLEITLPVVMQAFERMALFLERVSVDNLLIRVNQSGMTAAVLHSSIIDEIRNEFNHNVAQQVYLSNELWNMIVTAKEDLVTRVNATFQETDPEASSLDYAKKLLERTMENDIDSIELALSTLKEELSKYYQI
ncbi:MAG: hypothetical protein L3J06_08655 [Cyclobacteriaceae bacterium]|nr:hypothetical protein [Cyclobacteriaceae bacterium]